MLNDPARAPSACLAKEIAERVALRTFPSSVSSATTNASGMTCLNNLGFGGKLVHELVHVLDSHSGSARRRALETEVTRGEPGIAHQLSKRAHHQGLFLGRHDGGKRRKPDPFVVFEVSIGLGRKHAGG